MEQKKRDNNFECLSDMILIKRLVCIKEEESTVTVRSSLFRQLNMKPIMNG
jgi:hypothetical protein